METTHAPHAPAIPRPSAAVVLVRPAIENGPGVEVFMLRRHAGSDFAPDVYVFPGGSVSPSDRETELAAGVCVPPSGSTTTPEWGSGYYVAALRECFEEAGVLLAYPQESITAQPTINLQNAGKSLLAIPASDVERFAAYRAALYRNEVTLENIAAREGLVLATNELIHWAHWITPAQWPKRFTTHFFLAAMPGQQEAAHDRLETTAGCWISPEVALAAHEKGQFPLVFATYHQLLALTGLHSVIDALQRFAGQPIQTNQPRIVSRGGADIVLMPNEPDLPDSGV